MVIRIGGVACLSIKKPPLKGGFSRQLGQTPDKRVNGGVITAIGG
jgi:hypothetical protein